mmetsp:Transcript_106251/g.327994  ORF Transcript_106251/g.327994 Transcript_106251/m.327994 type:complete len:207 (+) Transcript_106251:769-1389(+)
MSCGSASPSSATGALPPVCTCEIQSKRTVRSLLPWELRGVEGADRWMSSSRKTLHFAAVSSARRPRSPNALPQMSNSSRAAFVASASAMASAPASPILLSRRESLRIMEPERNTSAMARAPVSPMPLLPRQSSPIVGFDLLENVCAMAWAPLSPRPMLDISSSGSRGGARRHSKLRAALHKAHIRARSPNVGSQSRVVCSSSPGSP